MDWSFSPAKHVELVAEILRLRAEREKLQVEVERLQAEVEALRARIAELEQPRAKKKRGRPAQDEVGPRRAKQLAAEGRLATSVNLETGAITRTPRVRERK
jgi:uncharacterized protein YlxW (UPF0749 family)